MASHHPSEASAQLVSQTEWAAHMYDQRAAVYEDSWHPAFVHDFLDQLAPPIQPGSKVLDLACGTGLVTFLAAARVGRHGEVVGVDISSGMLSQARARQQAGFYPHVRLHQHDIVHLDDLAEVVKVRDEAGGFDLVTCASAFVLLDDPSAALRYWTTFLKPGGRLLVDVTTPQDHVAGILLEKVGNVMGLPVPWHRTWVRGPESLHAAFEQAGLEVQNIRFVSQGKGETRYLSPEELQSQWDGIGPGLWKEELTQRGLETKAKELFRQEISALAVDGKIKEVDGVYVGVAVRPQNNLQRRMPPLPDAMTSQHTPGKEVYTGGCRCGAVKWSAFAQPKNSLSYCHCFTCRRLSGAPFIVFADFHLADVQVLGAENLQPLIVTPYAERSFCGKCGSPMTMRYRKAPEVVAFPLGSLDDHQGVRDFGLPWKHIMLKEKAEWYSVPDDGLPRHDGLSVSGLLAD